MTAIPINFGPWLPDQPDLNNPGLTRAFNVIPGDGAYRPMQQERLYADTQMASTPRGATSGLDKFGNAVVLAGDDNSLYQLQPGTTTWVNVTRAVGGPYVGNDLNKWRFAEYGSLTIGTNYVDYPQAFDRTTSSLFENLTDRVKGRYIMVLKDFVVLGDIFTAADGKLPNALMWSGIGDPGVWTYSPTSMSDLQIINGYGNITGMVGGEYGIILMQRGIVRMTFTADASIFQFDPILEGKGCSVPESVISVDGRTFFLNTDGFYQFANGQLENIGLGKINQYFLKFTSNVANYNTMTVEADPANNLVYWLYASNNAFNNEPDRYLCYNYSTQNWSEGSSGEVRSIFRSVSLPFTVEQLSATYGAIENIPAPLDSPLFSGGKAYLAGLDMQGRIYSMSGEARPAEISTGEFEMAKLIKQVNPRAVGERALVRGIKPDVHADADVDIQARCVTRLTLQSLQASTAYTPMSVRGICPQRVDSRYQRLDFTLAGKWTQAIAAQVDAVITGSR